MGQSALSGRLTPTMTVVSRWHRTRRLRLAVCVRVCLLCPTVDVPAKGNRVNIPEPGRGKWNRWPRPSALCGNATDLGYVGESPGKSCLFFVKGHVHGIGLPGDMDAGFCKAPRFLWCPVRDRRYLKTRARRCNFLARPYPYPQQVSKVNSLWP
jgi:hypothetical protein